MWMAQPFVGSLGGRQVGARTGITVTLDSGTLLTGLVASMTVNALLTGLIVFRIFKVFREVKHIPTSNGEFSGITGGRKLRSVMFVIIESGVALFVIQLARVVVTTLIYTTIWVATPSFELVGLYFLAGIHEMLTVIILSVIVTLCFTDHLTRA